MNENIKAFMQKLSEDPELQKKLQSTQDADEAYALASSVQDGFTKEELVETMTMMKQVMDRELTQDDLAMVSGGLDELEITMIAATTVGVTYVGSMSAASAMATACG